MKQFEAHKKEYVTKLKHELNNVESRFHKVINQNNMIGEDYRSKAVDLAYKLGNIQREHSALAEEAKETT